MAKLRCQSNYTKAYYEKPYTPQSQASTLLSIPKYKIKLQHKTISKDDKNDRRFKKDTSFSEASKNKRRLLFKDILKQKNRWYIPPYIRPERTKSVCNNPAFPTNLPHRCCKVLTRPRLVSKDRPSSSLLPHTYLGDTQKVPSYNLQTRDPRTDSPAIWPMFSPSYVRNNLKLGCGNPKIPRYTRASISRRLPISESRPLYLNHSGLGDTENPGKFRLAYKLSKINHRAYPPPTILRARVEHREKHHSTTSKQNLKNKGVFDKGPKEKTLITKGNTTSIGNAQLCKYNRTKRQTTLQKATNIPKKVRTTETITKKSSTKPSTPRPRLVDKNNKSKFSSNTQEKNYPLLNNRRSGCGLGSSPKQQLHVRTVVSRTKKVALKPKRDVCSIWNDMQKKQSIKRSSHPGPIGQQNSGGLSEKRRRDTLNTTSKFDNQSINLSGQTQHNLVSVISTRTTEWNSRPSLKGSTSAGMAPKLKGHTGDIQTVGNSNNRLIRFKKHKGGKQICNYRLKRYICGILGRIQSNMGLPTSMGIPSAESNSPCPEPLKHCQRKIHNNNTGVESVFLVTRPSSKGDIQTNTNKGLTQDTERLFNGQVPTTSDEIISKSLDSWGWSNEISHWSLKEKELLNNSWRRSTLVTYKAPIRRWLDWCNNNKINPKHPEGNDIARFLANLFLKENLAYRTILVHKSAISTYCGHTNESYSKNFFINQILKAISLAKPPKHNLPIWDTKILFEWLKTIPKLDTFFEISRRTALILLLASGRRIHDLTLLEIAEDKFESNEGSITLWPRFGSKTDSEKNRQSGWRLLKHPDHRLCPVKHINLLRELSQNRRRTNNNIHSLFITITGTVKPASRRVIAGWIRTIFKESKIDAPPGSIRSAVASKSWLENRPVEEILNRGNWKSTQTFKKFYCKEVRIKNRNEDLLNKNFSII